MPDGLPETPPRIEIPAHLLPADGRFGSGPSRVRPAQLERVLAAAGGPMGTSHRQAPVRDLVAAVRRGLAELLGAPDGYEVVLGNGGSTTFWDVATVCLVERRAQHLVFGEFSAKFAAATTAAPFLDDPDVRSCPPGARTAPQAADVDAYCWPQNETSTGVAAPVHRVEGAAEDALVLVDATSAAAGMPVDLSACDAYYLAPQKGLASDGGLWLAVLSPAAVERAARLTSSGRWVPESLNLTTAVTSSRLDQTLNTPAVATLVMLADQLEWLLGRGGLAWAAARCAASAATLYDWAERSSYAAPFVVDPAHRSPVVGTVDLDGVDAATVSAVLRAHGVVDTEPYRKLGRNQLRVGMFPAVDPADVDALTACVDHVVAALT